MIAYIELIRLDPATEEKTMVLNLKPDADEAKQLQILVESHEGLVCQDLSGNFSLNLLCCPFDGSCQEILKAAHTDTVVANPAPAAADAGTEAGESP